MATRPGKCALSFSYQVGSGAGNPVGAGCNSLLDIIVGGCNVAFISAVKATQPDVPAMGGTSVVTLSAGAGKKVTIPAGQETEAYSAYLTFAANRAHFTGESCTTPGECQTGQACTSNVCK